MLRGLTEAWKQFVYYDFDQDMTKDLHEIIVKCEAAGFFIVAVVCDLGPTNVRLWNSLGINTSNSSFEKNPTAADRKSFRINSEQVNISSSSVRELVTMSIHDLKTTHTLSQTHINMQGTWRMKVCIAAKLMSETTEKSLTYFGERGMLESKDWDATSKFISLTDRQFDLFNSKNAYDEKVARFPNGNNYLSKIKSLVK